jgi:hypothetical protein
LRSCKKLFTILDLQTTKKGAALPPGPKGLGFRAVNAMTLSEEAMSFLEEHIPELADVAFKQAYWATLASGSSVLISENGDLVEIFPDGTRKFIKHLPPSTSVTPGQRWEING